MLRWRVRLVGLFGIAARRLLETVKLIIPSSACLTAQNASICQGISVKIEIMFREYVCSSGEVQATNIKNDHK